MPRKAHLEDVADNRVHMIEIGAKQDGIFFITTFKARPRIAVPNTLPNPR